MIQIRIFLVTTFVVVLMAAVSETQLVCPNETSAAGATPLYVLTLLPFPIGLGYSTGARLARDDINKRSDILPGYSIQLIVRNRENCSAPELGIGTSSFLDVAVRGHCHPVLAAIGLDCSSRTEFFSAVVGHSGFDALQFSIANSPIFEAQNHRFPHLWRFLGSATVYSNAVLAMMDLYNWKRIGIAYNIEDNFYTEITKLLVSLIITSNDKIVEFEIGVRETSKIYFDQVIDSIKDKGVTITILLLNSYQDVPLLLRAQSEGLVYPYFTFIYLETLPEGLLRSGNFTNEVFYNTTRGHIFLHTQFKLSNMSVNLASGYNYNAFSDKYDKEFPNVRNLYSRYNFTRGLRWGGYLYDQIWALALAVNNSIPILKDRSLSIDNYTIGQPEITDVIEEQLADVRFQGASGWVEFNQYRGVTTPVDVFWIVNGTSRHVGVYDNSLNNSNFKLDIATEMLPKDGLPIEYAHIHTSVAILLYIVTAAIVVFTTVQLVLYFYHRKHSVIKATSPYLSLLMFAGCYLICVAAILNVTTFYTVTSLSAFTPLVYTGDIAAFNGLSLVLITLFIKLLRVHRIFTSKLQRDIGRYWGRLPLFAAVICLVILPNVIVAALLSVIKSPFDTYIKRSQLTLVVHFEVKATSYFILAGFMILYIAIFAIMNVFLAINTRKICYSNFKDTKKINLFVVIIVVTLALVEPLYIILLLQHNEVMAVVIRTIGILFISASSQFILFLPKVLPIVLSVVFPSWETYYATYSTRLSHLFSTSE